MFKIRTVAKNRRNKSSRDKIQKNHLELSICRPTPILYSLSADRERQTRKKGDNFDGSEIFIGNEGKRQCHDPGHSSIGISGQAYTAGLQRFDGREER